MERGRLITASEHGWSSLRHRTFQRDGGCVAVLPAIFGAGAATDPCRDRRGLVMPWNDIFRLEWDHVRHGLAGPRFDDEAHGVMVCPWHHRGSGWRIDTKEHRAALRVYLTSKYPEVWGALRPS